MKYKKAIINSMGGTVTEHIGSFKICPFIQKLVR